jgi:hypothetical protein
MRVHMWTSATRLPHCLQETYLLRSCSLSSFIREIESVFMLTLIWMQKLHYKYKIVNQLCCIVDIQTP